MSEWRLVKLNFGRSPAHFGELGIGIEETSERVRSDTLFSAWISAYARLFGKDDVEELLQLFLNSSQPPVRMSSTFIYRQDERDIYYLPRPQDERDIYYLPRPLKFPINYPEGDDLEFFKTYKKLNYLPLEIWQRWYQGEGFNESDRLELIERTTKGKSKDNLNEAGTFDYKKAFEIDQFPKIAVDRITRATNLYHTGFVQFKCDEKTFKSLSGLYFLLQFPETEQKWVDKLEAALHLLGEEGLGGERSSGAGRFEVEWLKLPDTWHHVVNPAKPLNYHCLISLFWDDKDSNLTQLITEQSSYEIQERGGWIASPSSGRQLRRQMIRMFTEGSVFPSLPQGKLANVKPKEFRTHPIYRSGISLSLPIQVQDK